MKKHLNSNQYSTRDIHGKDLKMHKPQDRMIIKKPDGWANQRIGAQRPERVYTTQSEAIQAARENLVNAGGGELTIQGRDGTFRDKVTIAPGNDPFPPRG